MDCPLCSTPAARECGVWRCMTCGQLFNGFDTRAKTGVSFPICDGTLAEKKEGRDHAVGSGGSLDERFRLDVSQADAAARKRP
jgi:hypothetical protein